LVDSRTLGAAQNFIETSMDERKVLTALEEAKIQTLPDTAYYIPNFITEEDEQDLLHRVSPSRDTFELCIQYALDTKSSSS
jgi:hypothetical protein